MPLFRDPARGSGRVLVSDGRNGGTRDCIVAVRALAGAGYEVATTVLRETSSSPSRYVKRNIVCPPPGASDFADRISSVMEQGRFITLIPASEEVTMAIKPACAHLMDKVKLAECAADVGFKTVKGETFSSVDELLRDGSAVDFPVVVKPAIRSFKAFKAENLNRIVEATPTGVPIVVQPFISGPTEAISGVMWEGKLHSFVQERWDRIWPRECGLAAASHSVRPSPDLADGLSPLMSGYSGLFSAQFVDGHLLDLNFRVASTLPLAVAAGVNIPAIFCELIAGRDVPPKVALPGHRLRWISGEMKGLLHDLRRGEVGVSDALRILRPRSGTVHSMFSMRDPLPFLMRLSR